MDLACCHLPDFPAWAYAPLSAAASGTAVVARGRVVSADRIARRKGVEAGLTAGRARSLAPGMALHARDAGFEAAAWEGVLADLHALTPFLEDAGPGWLFLRGADPPRLRDVARRMAAGIGCARRRADARLAALRAAPGHVLTVRPEDRAAFLQRFPASLLAPLGFEEDVLERLVLLGYRDLAMMATLTRRQLDAQFGAEGVRLYHLLHPGDEPAVGLYQPPPVVSEVFVSDDALTQPGEVEPIVARLVEQACDRLDGLLCGRVTLTLAYGTSVRRSRVLKEATRDPCAIRRTAAFLVNEIMRPQGGDITEAAVELGALSYGVTRQAGLFHERPSLYSAVRRVHRRYPGSMLRSVVVPHALFEEDRTYFEPFHEAASGRRKGSRR